jgi:hypothetical protein
MLTHFLRSGKVSTNLTFVVAPAAQGGSTGSSVSQFTFSGINIGAENYHRYVIVSVGIYSNSVGNTFNNCRLGGVDMTLLTPSFNQATNGSGIYAIYAPTGTAANIQVNFNNTVSRNAKITVYRLIHPNGNPLDTNAITSGGTLGNAVTVNTASGGAALFMGMTVSADAGAAGTPTNYVENVDEDIRSGEWFNTGICNAALGGNVSMSNTGQKRVAAVSWT